MNTYACEWCHSEQKGDGPAARVLACPKCRAETWHYRVEEFEELREMTTPELLGKLKEESDGETATCMLGEGQA